MSASVDSLLLGQGHLYGTGGGAVGKGDTVAGLDEQPAAGRADDAGARAAAGGGAKGGLGVGDPDPAMLEGYLARLVLKG